MCLVSVCAASECNDDGTGPALPLLALPWAYRSIPHNPQSQNTGRFGLKLRRYSHVVVRLKEVDFEAALRACTNRFQRARWEQRRKLAEDVRRARSEEGGGGPSSA